MPLADLGEPVHVLIALRAAFDVDDGDFRLVDVMLLQQRRDHLALDEQDRMREPFIDQDLRGADDVFLIALGENDPLRIAFGAVVDAVHHAARAAGSCWRRRR